jgi:hypothetical protein
MPLIAPALAYTGVLHADRGARPVAAKQYTVEPPLLLFRQMPAFSTTEAYMGNNQDQSDGNRQQGSSNPNDRSTMNDQNRKGGQQPQQGQFPKDKEGSSDKDQSQSDQQRSSDKQQR